jgi:HK97 family phage major capsid protein
MFTEEQMKSISEMFAKSLETLDVAGAVEKALEEKGLNKIGKKFLGSLEVKEGLGKLEGMEKMVAFIKAVHGKDKENALAISGKGMLEGTDSAGGFAVPEEFRAEVVRLAADFGIVRKLARIIPMSRDTLNLPKVTASVTVSWPGEATAGTPSQPVLGQVQLLAKTLVGLTILSNELLEDAAIGTVELLAELFAEAISGEEDKQGLVGTGAPFTGILSAANTNLVTFSAGNVAFSNITADYLRDMISGVKTLALMGAGFTMHRSVWGIIQKLKGSDGQYIATVSNPILTGDASKGQGVVGYVWGYPVYLSEQMPSTTAVGTKFIIFGNLKYLYLGDRQQMALSVSQEATVGGVSVYETNQSAVRFIERIGLTVGLAEAFAIAKTAAV